MKLDFSEFHPMDHPWWRCKGYPGGLRRHINYSWHFVWRGRLHKRFLCPLGRHEFAVWYRGNGKTMHMEGVSCRHCDAEPTLAQYNEAVVEARGWESSLPPSFLGREGE